MKIRINETSEIKEISLIDRKTNICWASDLLVNHGADMEYDEGEWVYTMNSEDFDWWLDLAERYQAADDEYNEITKNHVNADDLINYVHSLEIGNYDIGTQPEALMDAINEWLAGRE